MEESCRVNSCIHSVDQAIISLTKEFKQYKRYDKHLVSCLLQIDCDPWTTSLMLACVNIEGALTSEEHTHIDVLFGEVIFHEDPLNKYMVSVDILNILKKYSLISFYSKINSKCSAR